MQGIDLPHDAQLLQLEVELSQPLPLKCRRGHHVVIRPEDEPAEDGVIYARSIATTPASSGPGPESRAI